MTKRESPLTRDSGLAVPLQRPPWLPAASPPGGSYDRRAHRLCHPGVGAGRRLLGKAGTTALGSVRGERLHSGL